MRDFFKHINIDIIIFIILIALILITFKNWSSDEVTETKETINHLAEKPDITNVKPSKPSGVNIKGGSKVVPENDELGTPLKIGNKDKGATSVQLVKSAGKNKLRETKDDLIVEIKLGDTKKTDGVGIKAENAQEGTGVREENISKRDPQVKIDDQTKDAGETSSAKKETVIEIKISGKNSLLATEQSTY